MKRLSQFLVLALVVGGGVGAALANASTQASGASAPEPRLGDWKTTAISPTKTSCRSSGLRPRRRSTTARA